MVDQDYRFHLNELSRRVSNIEKEIRILMGDTDISGQDWDNATLLIQWGISKRTAANYRRNGLEFYKRGGRIMYTPESREKFKHHGLNREIRNNAQLSKSKSI